MRTAGIAEVVAQAAGATTDRAGHVEVNPDLTLPGHPEISVIGDAAKLAGPDGKPLPGLATVAIQQARYVARAIRDGAPGASKPFKYFDKGALAVVGRGRAVCEVRGHRLSGLIAFLMYLGVHLFYLGGVGGRRITVTIDDDRVPVRCAGEPGDGRRVASRGAPVTNQPARLGVGSDHPLNRGKRTSWPTT